MPSKKVEFTELQQELKNKVLAIGLNSIAAGWSDEDQDLLNTFVSLSAVEVLPAWDLLNDKVRYQFFLKHFESFRAYLLAQLDQKE